MPATIPSHQAAVLGFKLWKPHRFDGMALVVGAAAPDAAYVVTGLGFEVPGHAWHALLWFNLPVTLVLAALIRRSAPHVVAHLPNGGWLALADYAVLASVRHPLRVTAYSALVGAASHLLWDSITHPYLLIAHPFLGPDTYLPALHATAFAGLPWWRVIHLFSELLGALITLAAALHVGRRRLLVSWHGPAPVVPARPAVFWPVTAAAFAALVAASLALPANHLLHVIAARVLGALLIATLLAAAAASRWAEPLIPGGPLSR